MKLISWPRLPAGLGIFVCLGAVTGVLTGCQDKADQPKAESNGATAAANNSPAPADSSKVLVETPQFSAAMKTLPPPDKPAGAPSSGAAAMPGNLKGLLASDTHARAIFMRGMMLDQKHVTPSVTVKTNKGSFVIKVMPKNVVIAAANFIDLARSGFYNGTIFHRYEPGFVIQGGDPTGTGTGGPGYTIPDQDGPILHDPGAVAMAKTSAPNSAGSQFYVVLPGKDAHYLDHKYTTFGRVIQGMEVVEKLRKGDKIISMSVSALPPEYISSAPAKPAMTGPAGEAPTLKGGAMPAAAGRHGGEPPI